MIEEVLGPEQVAYLESLDNGSTGRFGEMVEFIGRRISEGSAAGLFTEDEAKHDLDTALWIGYACNNLDTYEHYCTAVEWLARVEDRAMGCGAWYYRYANALMYVGKPRLAMEYLARGTQECPDYPWSWLTYGRLRAHYGNRKGAVDTAMRGLDLVPGDHEFLQLLKDIDMGKSIEEMEFHFIDPENDASLQSLDEARTSEDPETRQKWEAVMGICVDRDALMRTREALRPSGWIPDHPYCTFMRETSSGMVVVNLMMNEAYLSKIPTERIAGLVDSMGDLESKARAHLESIGRSVRNEPLYGMAVDRRLRPMLSFGSFSKDEPVTVSFDENLDIIVSRPRGGPFASFLLLKDDFLDLQALKDSLRVDWGIILNEDADGDNVVFQVDGDLIALSLMHSPVPNGEAESNASNNYSWPEAVDEVRQHTAHIIVAVVNHDTPPIDAGMLFVKIIASCIKATHPIGVYITGTVLSPGQFMKEAEVMRRGEIPVLDMIWIGLYRTPEGVCAYTQGMESFGKDEIEVLKADDDPGRVWAFVYDIVEYIMNTDSVLKDGDTIGFSSDQRLRITRSRAVAMDGISLKIEYPRRD